MQLDIFTGRVRHHGCPGYTGRDALNITRGSGGGAGDPFAPSRELLDAANACKSLCKKDEAKLDLLFAWYSVLFLVEMRASVQKHWPAWWAMLHRGTVTLCCYCGTARRCHRGLLADVLVKVGARHGVKVTICGERNAVAAVAR